MIVSLVVAALLAAEPQSAAAGTRVETTALVEGKLPDAPGKALVETKCLICHGREYVTQQRLTPAQWASTVAKMRKFGSPLSDEEVTVLSEYLGRHWTVELPERAPKPVRAPRGAVPGK